ncbi:hypothetical protein B7P43_G16733 [Cryptotermes secundus]|uniref:Uncharacterized protein n=1 Tax=Cryptotermes secundus TaxID=105785 RepID=A0A2J7PBG5_9NEOP|nr:hypothetical protein B7P43_G16733 [Cryptotermes secundus]
MRAQEAAREREHCCSRSADPGVLVEGSFFIPRVLGLKTVYHILECELIVELDYYPASRHSIRIIFFRFFYSRENINHGLASPRNKFCDCK